MVILEDFRNAKAALEEPMRMPKLSNRLRKTQEEIFRKL